MTQKKETPPAVQEFLERVRSRRPQLQKVELKSLGTVYLRAPTGADQVKISVLRNAFLEQGILSLPETAFAACSGAVLLLQEDGEPFFETPEDGYEELSAMKASDLEELWAHIKKISSPELTPEAVETAEKKSSSDQNSQPGTN